MKSAVQWLFLPRRPGVPPALAGRVHAFLYDERVSLCGLVTRNKDWVKAVGEMPCWACTKRARSR